MSSIAIAGKNTTITLNLLILPEIIEIGVLTNKTAIYDVTYHSTSRYRDIIPGLFDIVEYTIEANYEEDQYKIILDYAKGPGAGAPPVSYPVIVAYPDGATHTFTAYVTEASINTPLDAQMTMSIALTVSGEIVFTP